VDIHITGRSAAVTDAMKGHAKDKLGKLDRHNDMVTRAEVVMNKETNRCLVEMIAHTKVGGQVIGKAEHTDMYAAVDLLLEKMDHQLTKQKEKVKGERKSARTKASGAKSGGREPSAKRAPAESEGEEAESSEM
jgi:putative sigma-54 modulation protein